MNHIENTQSFLKNLALPSGDAYSLPDSDKRFEDGSLYRFEVPGIQSPSTMLALFDSLNSMEIQIHRVTQTKGIMLLTDQEIAQMVKTANENSVELVLAVGPRATYDTSACLLYTSDAADE